MIVNTIGLTADNYQSIYVSGGDEVAEVYGGINYADPIFYKTQTLTGTAPLYFDAYPGRLTGMTILGNSYQDGVPSPEHPVEVQECGERTENLWDPSLSERERIFEIKPYTSYVASKYAPLGEQVGRLDLTIYDANMNQLWTNYAVLWTGIACKAIYNAKYAKVSITANVQNPERYVSFMEGTGDYSHPYIPYGYKIPITCGGVTQNIYLDEPLRKQLNGDAADEINYTTQTLTRRVDENCDPLQTPTTEPITVPAISTISGSNTLSIGTTLQPSSVSITGHIKPTGYGQLVDVNGVQILDKDNVPVFVHGQ